MQLVNVLLHLAIDLEAQAISNSRCTSESVLLPPQLIESTGHVGTSDIVLSWILTFNELTCSPTQPAPNIKANICTKQLSSSLKVCIMLVILIVFLIHHTYIIVSILGNLKQ